jgi:hypothetical protein
MTILFVIFFSFLARAEDAREFLPIKIISRPALDGDAYDLVLSRRIIGRAQTQDSGCAAEATRVKIIFDNLIERSKLKDFSTGPTGFFPVVPCDSTKFMETGSGSDGRIVISRWITKNVTSDAQLAFIIAHEIGHFTLAHDELHIRGGHGVLVTDESAADDQALRIMYNAGYDTHEAIAFQTKAVNLFNGPLTTVCTQCMDIPEIKKMMADRLHHIAASVMAFVPIDNQIPPSSGISAGVVK